MSRKKEYPPLTRICQTLGIDPEKGFRIMSGKQKDTVSLIPAVKEAREEYAKLERGLVQKYKNFNEPKQ